MGNRSGTGHEVRDASTAHSTHRQAVVPPATGVWSSDIAYHQTLTRRHCAANAQPGPILTGHPERYAPTAATVIDLGRSPCMASPQNVRSGSAMAGRVLCCGAA